MPDLSTIPFGSWPQWLLLLVVALGFIKWLIPWRADEMRKLRIELNECKSECAERLKKLEEDLWGEKRQRVAEQIAFARIIMKSEGAPDPEELLRKLESAQAQIRVQHIIDESGGVE